MNKQFNSIVLTVSLLITLLLGTTAFAQDSTAEATDEASTEPQVVYYLADGDNGLDQVFQQVLDGQNNRQQITNSESDIVTFTVAADGASVAYIANGRLQLQEVDSNNAPEELTVIDGGQSQGRPVFSPDGEYLAYRDQGVWLMNLSTRETSQILEDVPFDSANLNVDDVRQYSPDRFVTDPTTGALKLVVSIGLYEYFSTGVFDLTTGASQELEAVVHHELLTLSDGRVLIYGNTAITGDESLEIATSLDHLTDTELLLDLKTLPNYSENYGAMFVYEVIEIDPETLRVFFYPLHVNPAPANGLYEYYFDYDLESGAASEVQHVRLGDDEYTSDAYSGVLSPDGMSIAMYSDYAVNDTGTEAGIIQIYDLVTGEQTTDVFPDRVGEFQWQQ